MNRRRLAVVGPAAALVGMFLAACTDKNFPMTPTPVANAAVTTLSGGSWSGNIVLSNGTITNFNMTLVARGVGLSTGVTVKAQTPGTVEVSGDFETASGLTGTVQGALQGTLQNGSLQGIFTSLSPHCSRLYTGPITESSTSLIPAGDAPPGCPLTFSIQISRERGPACHYSISLDRQSFPGSGGSGVATVDTGPGCSWAAESPAPWIQVVDTTPKVGPGTVSFTVGTNGEGARDAPLRFTSPNQTFTIRQGPACALTVQPLNASVPGSGGSGRIALDGPSGCEWIARSNADWIDVSPTSGSGPATITFTGRANPGLARQGTFSVGGQTVTLSQTAGCALAVTPLAATVPMGGGSGSISVTGVSGCGWAALSNVDWISLSPASGDGNGTVSFTGLANNGPPRQGTLNIAGQVVTISQGTCTAPVTVSVSLSNIAAAGGTGTVSVIAVAGCPWTAVSNVPWITLSTSGGTGNGTLALTVQPNAGPPRQGTLNVAGQILTITQDALQCLYELRPTSDPIPFPFTGGTRAATVTAPAGCAWTVAASSGGEGATWLSVVPASGVGTGTFSYTAAANLGTRSARTGTVTLTGGSTTLVFAVSQSGDTTGPAVAITAPAAGDVGGAVLISADATDNQAVFSVQFTLDGQTLQSPDLTFPYSIAWNSLAVANGTHTLGAIATDTAGNITTAATVTVNVSNIEGPEGGAPSLRFNTPVRRTPSDR